MGLLSRTVVRHRAQGYFRNIGRGRGDSALEQCTCELLDEQQGSVAGKSRRSWKIHHSTNRLVEHRIMRIRQIVETPSPDQRCVVPEKRKVKVTHLSELKVASSVTRKRGISKSSFALAVFVDGGTRFRTKAR